MPVFKFDSPDNILLSLPYGKKYMGLPSKTLVQSQQKGNTCWYYAMNYLRFRYGKFYSESSKERIIEKIFSTHRVGINLIEAQSKSNQESYQLILEEYNEPITPDKMKAYIDNLKMDLKRLNLKFDEESPDIKLFQEFLNSTPCPNFEEFLDKIESRSWIDLCIKTINSISKIIKINPEDFLQDYIKDCKSSIEDKNGQYLTLIDTFFLNLEEKAAVFQHAIINLAAKYYGLEKASWVPEEKPDGLIQQIRKYGPLLVYTQPGLSFCNNERQIYQSLDDIDIYAGIQDDENSEYNVAHAILVVDVKKEKGVDYIYFVDPNDSNPLQGKRKLYIAPYNEFLSCLNNIYNVSFRNDEVEAVKGPFAFHAAEKEYEKIFNFTTSTNTLKYSAEKNDDELDADHGCAKKRKIADF